MGGRSGRGGRHEIRAGVVSGRRGGRAVNGSGYGRVGDHIGPYRKRVAGCNCRLSTGGTEQSRRSRGGAGRGKSSANLPGFTEENPPVWIRQGGISDCAPNPSVPATAAGAERGELTSGDCGDRGAAGRAARRAVRRGSGPGLVRQRPLAAMSRRRPSPPDRESRRWPAAVPPAHQAGARRLCAVLIRAAARCGAGKLEEARCWTSTK